MFRKAETRGGTPPAGSERSAFADEAQMPKFVVMKTLTQTFSIVVEADDEESAEEIAANYEDNEDIHKLWENADLESDEEDFEVTEEVKETK